MSEVGHDTDTWLTKGLRRGDLYSLSDVASGLRPDGLTRDQARRLEARGMVRGYGNGNFVPRSRVGLPYRSGKSFVADWSRKPRSAFGVTAEINGRAQPMRLTNSIPKLGLMPDCWSIAAATAM